MNNVFLSISEFEGVCLFEEYGLGGGLEGRLGFEAGILSEDDSFTAGAGGGVHTDICTYLEAKFS